MPAAVEIEAALAETAMLIEREPTIIVIQRPKALVSDGAGGWIKSDDGFDDLEPQTVFLSAVTRDSDYRQSSFVRDDDGVKYINHIIIVGMPALDIKANDEFDYLGKRVKVSFVHPEKRWQCKAEADRVVPGDA